VENGVKIQATAYNGAHTAAVNGTQDFVFSNFYFYS
jgi:hypothetical protein